MIQLEKYHGTKSRHACPACGVKGAFVRYIKENGEYISFDVGRCNRESKCGYHKKPKEFFIENSGCSTLKQYKRLKHVERFKRGGTGWNRVERTETRGEQFDTIPFEQFKRTLGGYERNAFVQFIFNLFPDCAEEIQEVLRMYFVGTYEDYACFPSIDRQNNICRAKLIRFNPENGKRLKGDYDTSSLPAKLKLKDFNYKQLFFGEHLLSKFPDKPAAIVEAEKTTIIASLCFPEFVWLACNSKAWLNAGRLSRIGNRKIILYPDADGFELWQKVALEARNLGATVNVSSLIENHATDAQKAGGYDLADYLINQQSEINENNEFCARIEEKARTILNDDTLFADYLTILNESAAIFEINGGLSRADAVDAANEPKNVRRIIQSL